MSPFFFIVASLSLRTNMPDWLNQIMLDGEKIEEQMKNNADTIQLLAAKDVRDLEPFKNHADEQRQKLRGSWGSVPDREKTDRLKKNVLEIDMKLYRVWRSSQIIEKSLQTLRDEAKMWNGDHDQDYISPNL